MPLEITIAPGVVMASSPALPTQPAEEAARKREVRLMKNREAARECRRKKKEYVKCLENRVAVLENQNKTLIEEFLNKCFCHRLQKYLYCHSFTLKDFSNCSPLHLYHQQESLQNVKAK
uniref:BZIP domain-containing protein n=1 Tax=Catagonus wagneri TaxID=51154 RepID=A0A8C3X967_9CETA